MTDIIICGPTATGKSDLGINLAALLSGEIISIDSRQAYSDMDIGTGKDLPPRSRFVQEDILEFDSQKYSIGYYIINQIKHWLFDLAKPTQQLNAGMYHKAYNRVYAKLQVNKKVPILVGGTGFYLHALLNPPDTINVPPDQLLRNELEKLDLDQLQKRLISKNNQKWQAMNQSDRYNPRRLIRAIEVSQTPPLKVTRTVQRSDQFWIGLRAPQDVLYHRIEKRVEHRLDAGFIDEVKMLIHKYPGFLDVPSGKTLGYAQIGAYLSGLISIDTATDAWIQAEKKYSKRQLTWFNKQSGIQWFDITDKNWYAQVNEQLKKAGIT